MTNTQNRIIIDEIDCTDYVDFDYLDKLFEKHLNGYRISTRDIHKSVKGLSRFRTDGLYSKVCAYVTGIWKEQLYLANRVM